MKTLELEGSFELDEISVLMNGFDPLGGSVALDGSFGFEKILTEEVLEIRDGELSKLRRTIDVDGSQYVVDLDAMGESRSEEDSRSGVLVGHTLELSMDEDGELSVVDVTEGDVEAASAEALEGQDLEGIVEGGMLPDEAVEIGESWELATSQKGLLTAFRKGVLGGVEGVDDAAEIKAVLDIMLASTTVEAQGTLVDVEDGIAMIAWSFEVEVNLDDLVGILQAIADPEEIGAIPDGVDSSLVLSFNLEAEGRFDLNLHRLVLLNATGELTLEASAAFSEEKMELEAEALLSSSFQLKSSVEFL